MDNNIPENPESWSYPKTKVSKEEGNILEEKLDGLYVPGTGVALSHEAGNGLVQKSDGLYVGSSESIVLKLNSAFSESELLYHIMTNYAGVECSGFFYNTDQDEYCEFEGLYSPYTVGSETIHFGYMHITGLHTSVYSVDYYIDDEFEDTWHKRTANDYVKSSDDLDLDDSDTLATSKSVFKLNNKISEIELYKFPNAVIIGTPTINNGQISNFTSSNYLAFPFLVDLKNKPFTIDICFTTGNDVSAQHNIMDSRFGLAFAVIGSRFVLAISTTGENWDLGSATGSYRVLPNTTYYVKIAWDGTQYVLSYSVDKVTYINDISVSSTSGPYPKQVYIGIGDVGTSNPHPFDGIINMNNCFLTIGDVVVWSGMDDVGLASRLSTDLANVDSAGVEKIVDISKNGIINDDESSNDTVYSSNKINTLLPSAASAVYATVGPKSDVMNLLVLYNATSTAVYIVNNTGLKALVTGDESAFTLSWVAPLKYFNVKSTDNTPLKYLLV